jgi:hypothetical protein
MPRKADRPALNFKQRDVSRAIRGVIAEGKEVDTVIVNAKTGDISIITVKPAAPRSGERSA